MMAGSAATLAFLPAGLVPSDLGTGIGDKAMHGVLAAIIAMLLLVDARIWREARAASSVMALLVIGAGFCEVLQPCFGRAAEWMDWLAAAAGILVARGVVEVARRAASPLRALLRCI